MTAAFNGGLTDVMNLPTVLMNALPTVIGDHIGVAWTNFEETRTTIFHKMLTNLTPPVAT